MITLCPQTKQKLQPVQVTDLLTILACHRNHLPAFCANKDLHIVADRSSLILVNGDRITPHELAVKYAPTVFDTITSDMDWENPVITGIAKIKYKETPDFTGCIAYNDEGVPIQHFPLSGVQQLYQADPARFM